MTWLDWRIYDDNVVPQNTPTIVVEDNTITPALTVGSLPWTIGGGFSTKRLFYPAFGTVNGANVKGITDGVFEMWDLTKQGNAGFVTNGPYVYLKRYPIVSSTQYYAINWDLLNHRISLTSVYPNTPGSGGFADTPLPDNFVTNQWCGFRIQFRWTDRTANKFEMKCWGRGIGSSVDTGWFNLIGDPLFGTTEIYNNKWVPAVPVQDNPEQLFMFGDSGGSFDNSLDRYAYFDNIKMTTVPDPPL